MTMEMSVVPRSEGLRPSMILHGTSYCAEDTWPWRPTNVMCGIRSVQPFFCLSNQSLYVLGWKNYASKFEDSTRRFFFAANPSCQVVAPF